MKGVYFIFKMVYNLFCYKVHKQKTSDDYYKNHLQRHIKPIDMRGNLLDFIIFRVIIYLLIKFVLYCTKFLIAD